MKHSLTHQPEALSALRPALHLGLNAFSLYGRGPSDFGESEALLLSGLDQVHPQSGERQDYLGSLDDRASGSADEGNVHGSSDCGGFLRNRQPSPAWAMASQVPQGECQKMGRKPASSTWNSAPNRRPTSSSTARRDNSSGGVVERIGVYVIAMSLLSYQDQQPVRSTHPREETAGVTFQARGDARADLLRRERVPAARVPGDSREAGGGHQAVRRESTTAPRPESSRSRFGNAQIEIGAQPERLPHKEGDIIEKGYISQRDRLGIGLEINDEAAKRMMRPGVACFAWARERGAWLGDPTG